MDYTERFSSLTIHFQTKETCFFQIVPVFFTKNSRAKLVYIAILFDFDFMLEGKGADDRRLREDNSHR